MKSAVALCALLLVAVSGCASPGERTLTVFAAASLSEVFEDLADGFSTDVDVRFSFAGSADLVAQISEGAPADVVATADVETMGDLESRGALVGQPAVFATNTLSLAVTAGNPRAIASADDLAGVDLVVCAPQVPCGAATQRWEQAVGADLDPVSEENSVTDVLGKVSSGQADAGIVYRTDVRRADPDVDEVVLDGAEDVVNRYPAAAVAGGEEADARAFVEFLRSDRAQRILTDAGFGAP
ncbi:molybdate transport system substrate-binding protein [Brevibacterium sanguinis]|uniref:Molybdate transport system substrate-binding protein n=2 Tax=Brevibacterium TaxID=1696 RepID=A0A366IJQ0_9MICO|nr:MULTISPECIES: molybdate ABC transporter substrate-binding protein [Brevibacterium]RBP64188.1 molybdate transport system substrate-binding protein [Brevibacterium sanguinis]RBP71520.1 molybdate transport system substrate-binding protein [Brevibacterium celere]